MSCRICFIGDSHMAAIKLGWDVIASQYTGVECTFFGSAHKRGADMEDLAFRDGVLTPTTADLRREIGRVSGGMESLSLSDFDIICIVGLQFGFTPILNLLRRFRTHSMVTLGQRSFLVSRAFLKQTIRDRLERSSALKLVKMIKPCSSARLLIVPSPLPAEARIASEPWSSLPREPLAVSIGEIHQLYESAASQLVAEEGGSLVVQPRQSLALRGLSRNEFSRDAVRLEGQMDRAHEEDNVSHMNKDYGVLMVGEVLRTVGSAPGPAS